MGEQNVGTSQTLQTILQLIFMAEQLAPGVITAVKDALNSGKPLDQLLSEADATNLAVIDKAASEQQVE